VTRSELISQISDQAKLARAAILKMTTLAKCGHPGGSLSSIDVLLSIYNTMKHDPKNPFWEDRDYMVVSIGHISPAVYSTLSLMGYFPLDDAIAYFRVYGSIFEGHIEREVPGVEWTTGNLGQGLSAGCGFALSAKIKGKKNRVYVHMGDGEQQKGQISEARRFAVKYKLNNLTAIIDYNQLQISGSIYDVMPQSLRRSWEADGWQVLEINGHDIPQILGALEDSGKSNKPTMILSKSVMGKGISFMENKEKYHGSALNLELCQKALAEIGAEDDLALLQAKKDAFDGKPEDKSHLFQKDFELKSGYPILYENESDCRGAWGNALLDLAKINKDAKTPIITLDCDLSGSVKTDAFAKEFPEHFFQCGIMEHHAIVMGGALSACDMQTFWAGFGMFGAAETYNMQRLNDINHANLKTMLTHVGVDVGEDGKTHQSIDYIALARNLFNTRIICPSDANHTDRIVRWLIDKPGNCIVAMGRSKIPTLKKEDGSPFYDEDYVFEYGKADLLRKGDAGTVFVCGTTSNNALSAIDMLAQEGINLQLYAVGSPLEIDSEIVAEAAKNGSIFVVEDHSIHGGLGATIKDELIKSNIRADFIHFGIRAYPASGSSKALYKAYGLDADSIASTIKGHLNK
jgi:transketolase